MVDTIIYYSKNYISSSGYSWIYGRDSTQLSLVHLAGLGEGNKDMGLKWIKDTTDLQEHIVDEWRTT